MMMLRRHWLVLLVALGAAFFLMVLGCDEADDDDDSASDDDASDDDTADDDTGDDDTGAAEDCELADLMPDGDATYSIGSTDDHVRHSYVLPDGIDHIVATMSWTSDITWEFTLDIGEGTCPHSGTTWGSSTDSSGEIVTELWASEVDEVEGDTFPDGATGFAHIAADAGGHDSGDSVDYLVEVELCKPAEG